DAEAVAREQLLGHRGATEHMALFEDQRLHPGPGQVGGTDEPVVAAADDHRVVALGHEPLHAGCIRLMQRVAEGPAPGGARSAARLDIRPWRPLRTMSAPHPAPRFPMSDRRALLRQTAELAADFLDGLPTRKSAASSAVWRR